VGSGEDLWRLVETVTPHNTGTESAANSRSRSGTESAGVTREAARKL